MEGNKFAGIDLAWTYIIDMPKGKVRLTMEGYTNSVLIEYGHIKPTNPQLLPPNHFKIHYGAKSQLTPFSDTITVLNDAGIKKIQGIAGAFLYYGRAVENKLLVVPNPLRQPEICCHQAHQRRIQSTTLLCIHLLHQSHHLLRHRHYSCLPLRCWIQKLIQSSQSIWRPHISL